MSKEDKMLDGMRLKLGLASVNLPKIQVKSWRVRLAAVVIGLPIAFVVFQVLLMKTMGMPSIYIDWYLALLKTRLIDWGRETLVYGGWIVIAYLALREKKAKPVKK
jgi:hypothetical protein